MPAVTILGNNSAVPAFDRHPTSQVVTLAGTNVLVDCGEGTQIQMLKYKIRRSKISHIFISHLHGDHYFGLVGLLHSFGLLGHQQEMHVFGPPGLQQIIELQLKSGDTVLSYALHFHILNEKKPVVDNDKFSVKCFRTNHRVECYGFVFTEKKKLRRIEIDKVRKFEIPGSFYEKLKDGEDYITKTGAIVKNESVTSAGPKTKSYAFCADTKYDESIIPYIENADLIYHEATYLEHFRERAEERFHSTAKQAAQIAKKANAKKLLIGHFSSRYDTLEEFETEAREIFAATELALEGTSYLF
jgi:ribonuclease Z